MNVINEGDPPSNAKPLDATQQRALRAIAVQFFVNGALFASFIPRLPEIRDQVGIGVAEVGLLMSIAGVSGLIGSATVGPTITRFGTRRVMLVAGTLVSLSLPLVGLATTQLVLLAGLVGMMSFDVLVDVSMNMQGSWLSARRQTPVMNRLHGLWSLGTVIGGISSSRIAASGISLSAHLVGASALLLVVLAFVSRGILRVDEHDTPTSDSKTGSHTRRTDNSGLILGLFFFAGLFAVSVELTSIDWAAFRFVDDFETEAGIAALGYVAVTMGMTIGRFAGDWAVARFDSRSLSHASTTLAGVGLVAATLSPNQYISLLGYVIAGLGIATMLPMLYDAAAKHPGRPGAGLGALTAGLRAASLTIPLLVGTLAATNLTVGSAIAIVTLPSLIGFFAISTRLRSR